MECLSLHLLVSLVRNKATVAASHFEVRKRIKIKLDFKNGSYASQVRILAKSRDALFGRLEVHQDTLC